MNKQQNKEHYNFKLDPRLMARVKELIGKLHYQPTLTQVVESGLKKECDALETILSGKKRGNG